MIFLQTPLTLNQILTVFFDFSTIEPVPPTCLIPASLYPHISHQGKKPKSLSHTPHPNDDPEFLYVAFLSGAETIFGRVHERERPTIGGGEPTPKGIL